MSYSIDGTYTPNQVEGFSDSENWELHETGKECKIHDNCVGSSSKRGNWYSKKNLTLNECKNECKDHKFMDWKEGRKFENVDGKYKLKNRSYKSNSARAWCECSNDCEPKEYSAYDIYVNKNWDTIMEEKYCGSNTEWKNGKCVGVGSAFCGDKTEWNTSKNSCTSTVNRVDTADMMAGAAPGTAPPPAPGAAPPPPPAFIPQGDIVDFIPDAYNIADRADRTDRVDMMDDDLLSNNEPEAFAGMTEKQAQKLKPAVVKNFSEKQVQEIDQLALNSMLANASSATEDQLTGQQLAAINKNVDVDGLDPNMIAAMPHGDAPSIMLNARKYNPQTIADEGNSTVNRVDTAIYSNTNIDSAMYTPPMDNTFTSGS